MKADYVALIGGLLFCTLTTTAFAAGSCKEDIARLCPDVKAGGGRILACLKAHQASVSPGCLEHLMNVRQAKEIRQACRDDAAVICSDVKPGKGRIIKCLEQHPGELSTECQEAIKSKSLGKPQ